MRILVVDDYRPFATSLRILLAQDHEVLVANSGQDALAALRSGADFDVLLLDVAVPDLSGLALLAAVRAERPELARRILFMSGGALSPEVERALAATGNPHLQKPFATDALLRLLREIGGT